MSATGFCPVTNFRTTLSSSVTSTQTNIPVSTITTTDGHVLTMADLGAEYYIVISPGASDMEIIKCTNIADGPPVMTASARGLAFYGITETTATGNNVAHNAGAVIELTNTHYVYKRFMDKEADETVGGVKTFSSFSITPSSAPTTDYQVANKKYVDDTTISGAPIATTTVPGIVKIATDAQLQAGTATDGTYSYVPNGGSFKQAATANKVPVSDSAGKLAAGWGGAASTLATLDSSSLVVQNPANATATPTASKIIISNPAGFLSSQWLLEGFGGTGADGALNITSGTTTTDLGSVPVFVKNYSSINISVGATQAFTNAAATNGTAIIWKSTGNVTLAGTTDIHNTGAAGGAAISITGTSSSNGNVGNNGLSNSILATVGGTAPTTSTPGSSSAPTISISSIANGVLTFSRYPFAFVGAGGSSGALNNSSAATAETSGAGGQGAGCLIIECAGTFTYTGAVTATGNNGGNGNHNGGAGQAGGGGGGGGGCFIVITNTLSTNTGTTTLTAGTGGNSSCSTANGSGGAGGGTNVAGAGGTLATDGNKSGGNGAAGLSSIVVNTIFN